MTVALGHQFYTDIALFTLELTDGVRLVPGSVTAKVVMTTLAEAMALAARDLLQLDSGELEAEWRPSRSAAGALGTEVEVYLYDAVPGGAGYATSAAEETHPTLLERTLQLLEGCDEHCDLSCYSCLRSYHNRWQHHLLDRHTAADLLRHCLYGENPVVDEVIAKPLLRSIGSFLEEDQHQVAFDDSPALIVNGNLCALHHPLLKAPDATEGGTIWINQMLVQRALPSACQAALGEGESGPALPPLPPRYQDDPDGVPVLDLDDLGRGPELATPSRRVGIPGAGPDEFIVQLRAPTLEDQKIQDETPLRGGAWVLCRKLDSPTTRQSVKGLRSAYIMIRLGRRFQATEKPWTVGAVQWAGSPTAGPRVKVRYKSKRRTCRPETVPAEQVWIYAKILRALED